MGCLYEALGNWLNQHFSRMVKADLRTFADSGPNTLICRFILSYRLAELPPPESVLGILTAPHFPAIHGRISGALSSDSYELFIDLIASYGSRGLGEPGGQESQPCVLAPSPLR